MRLLYVIHQFFPYAHSGTEQHCLAAAREARRRGDEVTVLSLHWGHGRQQPTIEIHEETYDGIRVLHLRHWQGINPNDVLRDYDNRHLDGWFQNVLEEVRPEAVHFFHLRQLGSNLIPVARQSGARIVVSLTDFWFLCPRFTLLRTDGSLCTGPPDAGAGCIECNHPELADRAAASGEPQLTDDPAMRLRALLDRPAKQLERLALADAVFAPSQFLADMFAQNGLPADRMEVLHYGLEAGRIAPIPAQRPRQPLQVAFCGVLSPWKAPHLAVEAVRKSEAPIELTVHGRLEEPMFADYIATVRTKAGGDPRIRFAGPYSDAEAPGVFANMDVLVVTSTWYENIPFVVLEAFAAGVPVVASDLGGLSEVVHDGENGLLFPAGDADGLREVLERIAGDAELYASLTPSPPQPFGSNYDRFETAYRG